jgi:phosphoribosylamine--glycine ligase
MNVLLIGSGGREHALALAISKSELLDKFYCLPGNPGIQKFARPFDCGLDNYYLISDRCKVKEIDLVVIGPEQPLADGLADFLREKGINVFGPSKAPARLESSKAFAKDFMQKYGIPTAAFKKFTALEEDDAIDYLKNADYPLVIKADGLAAGKGVIIAQTFDEAVDAVKAMFNGKFKEAGQTLVIEEFLKGEEASILAVSDGKDFITLAPSQDHKRAYDNDKGPNTGGMGAYAPAPIVNETVLEKVKENIIKPVIDNMRKEGTPFIGCLYAGLMIDNNEPKVVEFNVRFGDPETQVVLPIFDGDFLRLIFSAARGSLDTSVINNVANGAACCVVLTSEGYPASYKSGFEISGIEDAENEGAIVFHAGTKWEDGLLKTAGGRVLGVCAVAGNLKQARDLSYKAVDKINFENKFYRKDIATKGL